MGLQRIDEGAVVTLWVLIGGVDRGAGTSLSIALITTTSFRKTSPKYSLAMLGFKGVHYFAPYADPTEEGIMLL